jgi:hypothetical protein
MISGELIQDYLPTHSIGFKVVERTHPNLISVRIEWESEFNYVIEPEDPEIRKYFSGTWLSWAGARILPAKNDVAGIQGRLRCHDGHL